MPLQGIKRNTMIKKRGEKHYKKEQQATPRAFTLTTMTNIIMNEFERRYAAVW